MVNNTTRVNDLERDDADLGNDTEPATAHDVSEGATLGAIGGGIVGALAGGPVGAVVGVIAGGAASAAGVSAVDRHDHDYNRTVAGQDRVDGGVAPVSPAYGVAPITPVVPGSGAYDAYSNEYRSHFQSLPDSRSYNYVEYEPAYRYGYDLANDPRYQDAEWDAIEGSARTDWTARHEGTWDRFKDNIRYGWDRVRGRAGARSDYYSSDAVVDTAPGYRGVTAVRSDIDTDEVDDFTTTRPAPIG